MLLFRPGQCPKIPKAQLLDRFTSFFRGEWAPLLRDAQRLASVSASRDPHADPTPQQRADRAVQLAHLGELSAARQALTAEPLAPAPDAALQHLIDPARRPPEPYQPLPPDLLQFQPESPAVLDRSALLANLRRARKAAAPGPSGYTAEMLRVLLDDAECSACFADVCSLLASAHLPEPAAAAVALGRLVAIRKPSGGTRGLVIGDLLRRLVARTLAQQFSEPIALACSPHQYALSTRAGAEALIHSLQARTEADPQLTVVSVDVSAAYDTVSRQSMLEALRDTPSLSPCSALVRARVCLCLDSWPPVPPNCPGRRWGTRRPSDASHVLPRLRPRAQRPAG